MRKHEGKKPIYSCLWLTVWTSRENRPLVSPPKRGTRGQDDPVGGGSHEGSKNKALLVFTLIQGACGSEVRQKAAEMDMDSCQSGLEPEGPWEQQSNGQPRSPSDTWFP